MPSRNLAFRSLRLLAGMLCCAMLADAGPAAPEVKPLPDDPACTAADRTFMKRAFEIAASAARHGNTSYGALLVKDGKILMEFENNAVTSGDITHHAETGLISAASLKFDRATLAASTLYTNSEPCLMCCGAIRTAGIKRFVYGTTGIQVARLRGRPVPANPLQCREVFARLGATDVAIVGPVMEPEGLAVHAAATPVTTR